jgi:hypothetical protein
MANYEVTTTVVTNVGWVDVCSFDSPGCSCMAFISVHNTVGGDPLTNFRWRVKPETATAPADYLEHPAVSDSTAYYYFGRLSPTKEVSGIYPIPKGTTILQAANTGAGAATLKILRVSFPQGVMMPTTINGEVIGVGGPAAQALGSILDLSSLGAGIPVPIMPMKGRKSILIDNVNVTAISVGIGEDPSGGGTPIVLKACTVAGDGSGAKYEGDFNGIIYVWDHTSAGGLHANVVEEY